MMEDRKYKGVIKIMAMFKAKQRVIRVEERYIEAESKEEVLELIEWEDAGEDNAHFEI